MDYMTYMTRDVRYALWIFGKEKKRFCNSNSNFVYLNKDPNL